MMRRHCMLDAFPFSQKTQTHHFIGDYGSAIILSFSCIPPRSVPYSQPQRGHDWGRRAHGLTGAVRDYVTPFAVALSQHDVSLTGEHGIRCNPMKQRSVHRIATARRTGLTLLRSGQCIVRQRRSVRDSTVEHASPLQPRHPSLCCLVPSPEPTHERKPHGDRPRATRTPQAPKNGIHD